MHLQHTFNPKVEPCPVTIFVRCIGTIRQCPKVKFIVILFVNHNLCQIPRVKVRVKMETPNGFIHSYHEMKKIMLLFW